MVRTRSRSLLTQQTPESKPYYAFAGGWYSGHTYERQTDPCSQNTSTHCGYDIETGRNKPCRGCRTRIYCAAACGDTLHYASGKKGNPCPSAKTMIHARDTGATTGFACKYTGVNAEFLQSLSENQVATMAGIPNGPTVYEQLLVGAQKPNDSNWTGVGKGFCEEVENLDKVIHKNGETCYRYLARKVNEATAKQKSTDFCKSKLSAIKSELCTRENIGKSEYDRIAGEYCEKEGQKDEWCSCYNAFKGKCKTNPADFAGCEGVKAEHDRLLKDIPQDQLSGSVVQQFEERMYCRNNVCKITDGFKPDGADKCDMNLQLCIQDVKVAGHLVDSGINVTCNNKQETGGGGGGDTDITSSDEYDTDEGGGGGGGGGGKRPGKGAKGKDDDGAMTRKLLLGGGVGGLSSSICCCMILILVLVMMMGK